MKGVYLGHLPHSDPLRGYLDAHILPQVAAPPPDPDYRVSQLDAKGVVFLYEEKRTMARFLGKFRRPGPRATPEACRLRAETEFHNLLHLRALGFDQPPHFVVRPLGFAPGFDNFLAMDYLEGSLFSDVIEDAVHRGRRDRLYRKLSALAHMLSKLHNRTAGAYRVDFGHETAYLERLLGALAVKRNFCRNRAGELGNLGRSWAAREDMWTDVAVLVHGDATPANFLFGRDREVMAIDLERMRWADRVFDLGRVCGELKHFFLRGTGEPMAAEPFIGHFLWDYCHHFPDQARAFASVTGRLPFYMALNLLRVARNRWIDPGYRRRLADEAATLLRTRP